MNLTRNGIIIIASLFILGLFIVYSRVQDVKKEHRYTIGILQTATHPALDAARDAFIDAIKEKVGNKVAFVVRNGQGTISSIHSIAQQFHAKQDIDAIFAIATPAAQAIISVEQQKPICIAAVSVTSGTKEFFSASNVYGVSDMINVGAEVTAMNDLLPSLKTVGIIYCTAETNSIAMSQEMVRELEKRGINPLLIGVTSEAEIGIALTSALRKVDALLAPTDNMVANSIALIADMADKAGKPLIVSDNMLVEYGAFMARGVDYYESGKQAGLLTVEVLFNGKNPDELSIIPVDNKDIFINKQVSQKLNIDIPSLLKNVFFI